MTFRRQSLKGSETTLLWNKALWLDVTSHVKSFGQCLVHYYLTFVYEIASWIHNFSLIGVLAVTNHSVNTTLHYKLQNDIQSASGQTQFKVLGHNQCDQIWWPIWRIWKVFGHFSGLLMTWQVFESTLAIFMLLGKFYPHKSPNIKQMI